jgi:hypothetical protein
LGELNGSVVGEWKDAVSFESGTRVDRMERLTMRQQDPKELLEHDPDWFLSFTMILGVNLDPEFELTLSDLLWKGETMRSPANPFPSAETPFR